MQVVDVGGTSCSNLVLTTKLFSVQKVSVALHHAVALETAHALGVSASVDGRGRGALAA